MTSVVGIPLIYVAGQLHVAKLGGDAQLYLRAWGQWVAVPLDAVLEIKEIVRGRGLCLLRIRVRPGRGSSREYFSIAADASYFEEMSQAELALRTSLPVRRAGA